MNLATNTSGRTAIRKAHAGALIDAFEVEVRGEEAKQVAKALTSALLREAAEVAQAEGARLYDDMGQKAAQGAWSVAEKLRGLADAAEAGESGC